MPSNVKLMPGASANSARTEGRGTDRAPGCPLPQRVPMPESLQRVATGLTTDRDLAGSRGCQENRTTVAHRTKEALSGWARDGPGVRPEGGTEPRPTSSAARLHKRPGPAIPPNLCWLGFPVASPWALPHGPHVKRFPPLPGHRLLPYTCICDKRKLWFSVMVHKQGHFLAVSTRRLRGRPQLVRGPSSSSSHRSGGAPSLARGVSAPAPGSILRFGATQPSQLTAPNSHFPTEEARLASATLGGKARGPGRT